MIALALGGADCLHDDLARLRELLGGPWLGPVLAVNDAGLVYSGRIDHWATLHPDEMARRRKRRLCSAPLSVLQWEATHLTTWCHTDGSPHLDRVLPIRRNLSGGSGLFGVQVLQHLGFSPVLCGMPMDGRLHATPRGTYPDGWSDFETYRPAWMEWFGRGELADVRSMSGWTRDLCGEPTREWLASGGVHG